MYEKCREISKGPFRFYLAMTPARIIFNQEMAMYLVWLYGKPILHIVDTHIRFQNTIQIKSKRYDEIWYSLVEGWDSIYIGYPDTMSLDQESTFKSDVFNLLLKP